MKISYNNKLQFLLTQIISTVRSEIGTLRMNTSNEHYIVKHYMLTFNNKNN